MLVIEMRRQLRIGRNVRSGSPDPDLASDGILARRKLLQTALGGGAAAFAGQAIIAPAASADTRNEPAQQIAARANADAFEGPVRAVRGDELTIDVGDAAHPRLREVTLTSRSRVWSEGVWNARPPAVGDDLLVRSVIPGQVQMAWVNRVSFDADILRRVGSRLEAAWTHPGSHSQVHQDVTVDTGALTRWGNAITGVPGPTSEPLAAAHVVGFRAGQAVVATDLGYVTERAAEFLQAHPPRPLAAKTLRVPNSDAACIRYWSGNCHSFSCCTGCGACTNCSTSSSSQAAWPYVDGVQNCDNGCTSQCRLKCGDTFIFLPCGSTSNFYSLKVVDVGPCQKSGTNCTCSTALCSTGCSGDPCGQGGPPPRIVCLTAPTMARFVGSATCLSCTVGIYCFCSDCDCPYCGC